jgi:hypothetical protein
MNKLLQYGLIFGAISALVLLFRNYLNPYVYIWNIQTIEFINHLILASNVMGILLVLGKNIKDKKILTFANTLKEASIFALFHSFFVILAYGLIIWLSSIVRFRATYYDYEAFDKSYFVFSLVRLISDQTYALLVSLLFYSLVYRKLSKALVIDFLNSGFFKFVKIISVIIAIVFIIGVLKQEGGAIGYLIGIIFFSKVLLNMFQKK